MCLLHGLAGIRKGGQEGLQELQGFFHVAPADGGRHFGYHGVARYLAALNVVRQQTPVEADADFPVGYIQVEQPGKTVVVLNGQITALVEQRGNVGHVLGGGIEIFCHRFTATYFGRGYIETFQHLNQIGGRAAAEPVRVQTSFAEGVQQAEGIVDVWRGPREVVAVIVILQLLQCLFAGQFQAGGQHIQVLVHLCFHLFLRDAADGGVFGQHADVLDVVQFAEDA